MYGRGLLLWAYNFNKLITIAYPTDTLNAGLYPNIESCNLLTYTTTVIYLLSQYNRVNVKIDVTLRIEDFKNGMKKYIHAYTYLGNCVTLVVYRKPKTLQSDVIIKSGHMFSPKKRSQGNNIIPSGYLKRLHKVHYKIKTMSKLMAT